MSKFSSVKDGGGGIGIIVGIVQDTTTMDGLIIKVPQAGIEGYRPTGEIIIETGSGVEDPGNILKFTTMTLIDIGGEATGGKIVDENILVAVMSEAEVGEKDSPEK
jgi:hypothetical protein